MSDRVGQLADWLRPEPLEPPRRFPDAEPSALAARLGELPEGTAEELLAEAKELFAEPEERIAGVERRATTLQGTVAIAATVALSGAGLVIDPSKVPDTGWRIALAAGIGLTVLLLVATGFRALGATARIFKFRAPADLTLADRAKLAPGAYAAHRAAYLLWAYGRNSEIAAVKVDYLRKAAFWFRLALVALAALVILLVVYVATSDPPAPPPPGP